MDIVTLVAQAGGTFGLALFAIWMLNKVWEARLEESKCNAENWRQGAEEMRRALEENTKVLTQLLERLARDR